MDEQTVGFWLVLASRWSSAGTALARRADANQAKLPNRRLGSPDVSTPTKESGSRYHGIVATGLLAGNGSFASVGPGRA